MNTSKLLNKTSLPWSIMIEEHEKYYVYLNNGFSNNIIFVQKNDEPDDFNLCFEMAWKRGEKLKEKGLITSFRVRVNNNEFVGFPYIELLVSGNQHPLTEMFKKQILTSLG